MTTTLMPTLAVRAYEVLSSDDSPWQDLIDMEHLPGEAVGANRNPRCSPIDTADLLVWAFLYGASYAAARIDNPLGCEESWKTPAREAANKASRWLTSVGGRPEGEV